MSKCDRNCFSCKYDDCIISYSDISSKERYEIREIDERLAFQSNCGSIAVGKNRKSRNKRKYYIN